MITDVDTAIRKVDRFFMGDSPVHDTLRALARRLPEEGIEYAVIGGMALLLHGYERLTVDVDLLLTEEGLRLFRERLVGRGYAPAFQDAKKHFRDTATGVRVEVITTGEYPGDGKPKDISFPDPGHVAETTDGIRVIRLEPLIELKLASGLSATHRLKDLADVQQLIEVLNLPGQVADKLDQSVRAEYERLWQATKRARVAKDGPGEE